MSLRSLAGALAALLFLAPAALATPAVDDVGKPDKIRDIRRLLELTGSAKLGAQVMGQLIPQFRAMAPQVPAKFWDDFVKEASADELVDLVVPLYDQRLSHDDIKTIIRFYETPAGKRLLAAMPGITQESMKVGQAWGLRLGERVRQRLRQQGYLDGPRPK